MAELWISDVDLGDYGCVIAADPGQSNGLALSDASAPLLGAIGPVWLGEPTQAGARRLVITLSMLVASSAILLANLDKLKGLVAAGAVRIRFADRPTQEFRDARRVDVAVQLQNSVIATVAATITLTFELDDPRRYDLQPQGVPLSTSRAALPIGTMPSSLVTWVHGNGASLSGITLTLRNAAGDAVQTLGLTGTLGATEYLRIDHARTQITKYTAGVASDAISWFATGDFLSLHAADGNYELSQYPTLELSGTGTPVGLCSYTRAWE